LFDGDEDDGESSIAYEEFVRTHLIDCVVNLASAVNDAACWKTLNLNQQLLNKTKSDSAQVSYHSHEPQFNKCPSVCFFK